MAKPLTTTQLIKSLKQRAMIPTNDKTFSNDDFIEILNEEMDTGIVPEVLRQHEEYYTVFEEETLVDNQTRYRIPYRAIGNKLRDLSYVDSNENVYELSRISLEDLIEFQNTYDVNIGGVFYLENNEIVFPTKNLTPGTLRKYFHMRPNSLVLEEKTGKITNIDRNTGVITLSTFPTDFSSIPEMDFVSHRSPNRIEDYDKTPTSVNAVTKEVTFATTDIPSKLQVGDYVCKAQETPIPQIPVEMHTMLAQKGAIYCLEALGDTQGLENAKNKMERMEKDIDTIINNRVEGAPKKILNRRSALRDSVFRTGYKRRF